MLWGSAPVQRFTNISLYIKRSNPGNEFLNKGWWELILVATPGAEIHALGSITQKFPGQWRAGAAPVNEIVADQYPVGTRVGDNIGLIRTTVIQTVVRIYLTPSSCVRVLGVNIVSKSLLLASAQIGFLRLESGGSPILIERHRASHTHGVDDVLVALMFL